MKNRCFSYVVFLFACLILAVGQSIAAESVEVETAPLSFGIVPQQNASTLLRAWAPLLKQLQKQTGRQFVFRTAPDIPTFEKRVASGDYDFAYMNPYHFTVFNAGDKGYQALAKAKEKKIRGIIVVRKDSTIKGLDELHGQALAFPAPSAFAASVLPQAHLKAEQLAFDAHYVSSHDSVYKAVARGFFVAGGGVIRTFNTVDKKVREQLRILWTTPSYTPHAIAYHSRLETTLIDKVQQAMILMNDDEDGRLALQRLKMKGFEAATNADWDDVRTLQIELKLGEPK